MGTIIKQSKFLRYLTFTELQRIIKLNQKKSRKEQNKFLQHPRCLHFFSSFQIFHNSPPTPNYIFYLHLFFIFPFPPDYLKVTSSFFLLISFSQQDLNYFQIMLQNTDTNFFYQKETMGTTIMSVKYDGGVIACADSRTSSGGVYTVDRVADKIDYVHNHIIVLRSGMAAQSQNAAHKVRFLIDSHTVQQGKLPHVKTAARMFQKLNYEKGLQTGYIVAGWDPYEGPQVYSVNLGGACLKRDFTMGGSGSGFIYGYCDANYKPGMSFEEAKAFCINAVSLAMKRDGSSGGIIRLVNITQRGIEREYHNYESLPFKSS